MKIKPVRPKMSRLEVVKYYDKLCCIIAYLDTIGIHNIESAVRKMRNIVREEELLHMVNVVKEVDNLDYIVRKQMQYLDKRTNLCQINTAPFITTYAPEYIREGRISRGMQVLVSERCAYSFGDLVAKAGIVAANGNTTSKALLQQAYVAVSWARIVSKGIEECLQKWNRLGHKGLVLDIGIRMRNQMVSISNACVRLSNHIGDTPYDKEKPMWQQYHAAEDTAASHCLALIEEDNFNAKVTEYMTTDWMWYYIGRACLEHQHKGDINANVMAEVVALDDKMRLPFINMVKAATKKVGATEDLYDYVDYLKEHPHKVCEKLISKAIERVADKYNEEPTNKEIEKWN